MVVVMTSVDVMEWKRDTVAEGCASYLLTATYSSLPALHLP